MSTSGNQSVSIQIPDNAEPGDIITFNVNGNELELEIPAGSKVGDILEIQLAEEQGQATAEEEKEGGSEVLDELSIELPNNKILKIVQNNSSNSTDIGGYDGTNALVWPSARFFIESGFLSNLPGESPVLELGSGSGVIGLAYAASITITSSDTRVILTDVPSSINLLQQNVARNQNLFPEGVNIETKCLEWSQSGDKMESYPIILCSDLLYNPKLIPDLVGTLGRCWNPENGCVVMAVRWRKPELEREFFRLTERDLGIEWKVYTNESSISWCSLMWNEFGDPENEESNKYFSQTMISVGGELKPLSEITEVEVEGSMSLEEYNTWERAFIQIYIGKKK